MTNRVVGALLAVLSVAVLSGCDSGMFQGPISVKQVEGRLVIKVCTSGEVTEVDALTRGPETGLRWETFWRGAGNLNLVYGDEFVGGARDGVPYGVYSEPALPGGTGIDIGFNTPDGTVASAVLTVPKEGLPTGDWLRSDGSINSAPCLDK